LYVGGGFTEWDGVSVNGIAKISGCSQTTPTSSQTTTAATSNGGDTSTNNAGKIFYFEIQLIVALFVIVLLI